MGVWRSAVAIALVLGSTQAPRPAPEPQRLGTPATIAGRLLDYSGMPIANAHVRLTTIDLRPVRDVTTDADGAFTMTLVDSGQYLLRLIGRDHVVDLEPVRVLGGRTVQMTVMKGVVIHGRVVDERREPVGGVPVCGVQTAASNASERARVTPQATTDADGRFVIHHQGALVGSYAVAAFPAGCLLETPRRPPAVRLAKYPPSWAPGRHDAAQATSFPLDARTESAPVTITMTPGPVTHLIGRVAGYRNTSVVPGVVVIEPPEGPASIVRRTRIATDGRFDFHALPPGEYRLLVPPHVDAEAPPSWSITSVVVTGAPTQQVSLQLNPGLALAGSASFDGRSAPLYGVKVFSTVTATPTGGRFAIRGAIGVQFSAVDADGQFLIKGLVPGDYLLSVGGYAPLGWTVVSATLPTLPGQAPRPDALDVPFTIGPGGSMFGVQIMLTTRPGAVAGTVTGPEGKPAGRAHVLVFSTDSSYWRERSRRIMTVVAAEDGRFETGFVPDGDYFVVAGHDLPDLTNPVATLTPRVAGATRIIVKTGPPTRVTIRLNSSGPA